MWIKGDSSVTVTLTMSFMRLFFIDFNRDEDVEFVSIRGTYAE